MKQCPWCDGEHPDGTEICPVHGFALEIADGTAPPKIRHANSEEAEAAANATSEELPPPSNAPEGYHSLGRMNPSEAGPLLGRFEEAGIEFQIERVEVDVPTGRDIAKLIVIEIFVIQADAERAFKILSADWKV